MPAEQTEHTEKIIHEHSFKDLTQLSKYVSYYLNSTLFTQLRSFKYQLSK